MGTPARKVALIDVADYPREEYFATWHIVVTGSPEEGYRWQATIDARKDPVGFEWKGKLLKAWPEGIPQPVYPPAVNVIQAQYLKMSAEDQAKVREQQDAWRAACAKIYEASPKPRYTLDEGIGAFVVEDIDPKLVKALKDAKGDRAAENEARRAVDQALRDLADTAAQQWVLSKIGAYKIQPPSSPQGGHAMTLGPAGMLWDAMAELARWLARPFLMALSYSTTIRTNRLTQIINAMDGGAGAALIRIYDGSRPATCGTATTLLAEITCSDPSATESAQVLTFDNTPALTDASANASGTTTWFRVVDSTGTCCIDGNCGTSGSDMNWNSVVISASQTVTLNSFTITAGNA
jgi:hypothetical protein